MSSLNPFHNALASHGLPISRRLALQYVFGGGVSVLFSNSPLFGAAAAPPVTSAGSTPRAKSVIQIWLWGGPCHLDTFDPKPEAGADYCGQFTKPLDTKVPGMRINDLLPVLASQGDKLAILRGMTHGLNGHETASYVVQTGHPEGGRIVYPSAVERALSDLDLDGMSPREAMEALYRLKGLTD